MIDYLILQGLTEAQAINLINELSAYLGFIIGFSGMSGFWRQVSAN